MKNPSAQNFLTHSQLLKIFGLLIYLPMLLSLSPLFGFYAGQYIVSKFHAPNFVILMATTIGFLAAVIETVRILKILLKMTKPPIHE